MISLFTTNNSLSFDILFFDKFSSTFSFSLFSKFFFSSNVKENSCSLFSSIDSFFISSLLLLVSLILIIILFSSLFLSFFSSVLSPLESLFILISRFLSFLSKFSLLILLSSFSQLLVMLRLIFGTNGDNGVLYKFIFFNLPKDLNLL